jgi:hypothetical protein
MDGVSSAERAAQASAMIVESSAVADHLLDEQTRVEPYVMLERGPAGTTVRKLTVAEKLAHSEQTGVSVFMADEHEQEEFFDLLDRRSDS